MPLYTGDVLALCVNQSFLAAQPTFERHEKERERERMTRLLHAFAEISYMRKPIMSLGKKYGVFLMVFYQLNWYKHYPKKNIVVILLSF